MNWDSTSTLRSQLRAIAEAKTDTEAFRMAMSPKHCAVGTYVALDKHREPGLDIREAAKRAERELPEETTRRRA